jgi:ABC-type multidrug transport system fused ATPase/permease subunit
VSANGDREPPAVQSMRGLAVVAQGISMRYHPMSEPTLRGLTFTIKASQKIAIVGRTAAGKSSIFQTLLKFYSCEPGGHLTVGPYDVALTSRKTYVNLSWFEGIGLLRTEPLWRCPG